MKLAEFEKFVGDTPTVSYVGIRGDEDREGYVSTKPNIQAIFPFRKNIWSMDVIHEVLHDKNIRILQNAIATLQTMRPIKQLKRLSLQSLPSTSTTQRIEYAT